MTIFDQIGGSEIIVAAVDEFYERVLDDPALAPSFAGIDLDRLKAHQRAFLTVALGGPQAYEGRSLADAHDGLGITVFEFDRAVEHLVATFVSMDVDPAIVSAVATQLDGLSDDVVARERAAAS